MVMRRDRPSGLANAISPSRPGRNPIVNEAALIVGLINILSGADP